MESAAGAGSKMNPLAQSIDAREGGTAGTGAQGAAAKQPGALPAAFKRRPSIVPGRRRTMSNAEAAPQPESRTSDANSAAGPPAADSIQPVSPGAASKRNPLSTSTGAEGGAAPAKTPAAVMRRASVSRGRRRSSTGTEGAALSPLGFEASTGAPLPAMFTFDGPEALMAGDTEADSGAMGGSGTPGGGVAGLLSQMDGGDEQSAPAQGRRSSIAMLSPRRQSSTIEGVRAGGGGDGMLGLGADSIGLQAKPGAARAGVSSISGDRLQALRRASMATSPRARATPAAGDEGGAAGGAEGGAEGNRRSRRMSRVRQERPSAASRRTSGAAGARKRML